MKTIMYFAITMAFSNVVFGEDDIPLIMPEERQTVDDQSVAFSEAIRPALVEAAKSTVRVWSGSRRLAYGTVIGDGSRIITKWSEIARSRGELRVDSSNNESRDVKLLGVYQEEDIVLLKVEGKPLTPVNWSFEENKLGSFLAASQPDGRLASFGVVSVLSRNLRETDLAYLGVISDAEFVGEGVKIKAVAKDSGAATAGLALGDVILKVGDRPISGLQELKNALVGVSPGAMISLRIAANGAEKNVQVLLSNRPKLPQYLGGRLEQMERMGGPISQIRDSFSQVIQTDMKPKPNQIGGPVVDLNGRVRGITVARADRTRSFVMPAKAVVDLLKKEPENPALAQVRNPDEQIQSSARGEVDPQARPRGRTRPSSEERMRRHLSDMERLMEHMRLEMQGLDER